MAQASTEKEFFGDGPSLDNSLLTADAEIEPETYSEFYDLVTERLFKTTAEEGIGFLGKYIERRGSLWGLGSVGTSLRKHSYLQEDIGKSHPNEKDRIEEALVQLRDMKRDEGALTLDDVIAASFILTDEFDRRATFLLAYELGYLEARELGVSVPLKGKTGTTQRHLSKTEGQAYVAEILRSMDIAVSKGMRFRELMPKIRFLLRDGPQLYEAAVQDIKDKKYADAERRLTGLRRATDSRLTNIEGPIVYHLAQIALAANNLPLAEARLRETVMMTNIAFPPRYGVKQEDAYKHLIALHQRQEKTTEALLALEHLHRYYPQSALFGTHKKYIQDHAFAQGKSAFTTGDLETAVKCLGLETIVKPKNSWAWYYLGRTQHKQNRTAHAQAAFSEAVRLNSAFVTQDYQELKRQQ